MSSRLMQSFHLSANLISITKPTRRARMDQPLPTGEPFTIPVELGKIREFARATKSRNPAYDGPDALTPATFLMTAVFWSAPGSDPAMALARDRSRVLHGEQEFT